MKIYPLLKKIVMTAKNKVELERARIHVLRMTPSKIPWVPDSLYLEWVWLPGYF